MTREERSLTQEEGYFPSGDPTMPRVCLLLIWLLGACAATTRTSPGADDPDPPEPDAGALARDSAADREIGRAHV